MAEETDRLVERVRRFALPQGGIECRGTWIRQRGEMRFAPGRPWLPFEAEQAFVGSGIDFRWQARVRMAPLVRARVVDSFQDGAGVLEARVFGVIPVAFARGPATDAGEAMRGLAELPWRPFAFGGGTGLAFEAIPGDRLRAGFDDGRTRAHVDFAIDPEGGVRSVTAEKRPRLVGKEIVHDRWSGSFGDYQLLQGLRVPTRAEVTWHLADGPFTYWRGQVTELQLIR